jgi:hypothetical protein
MYAFTLFERIFSTFSGQIWRDKEQIKIENEIQIFQRKLQQSLNISLNNSEAHFPICIWKCKLEEYNNEVLSSLM